MEFMEIVYTILFHLLTFHNKMLQMSGHKPR